MSDEFYVGYLEPPAGLMSFVRGRVKWILVLALFAGGLLTFAQRPFSKAAFEFGTTTEVEGWLEADPYPTLLVKRPEDDSYSRYLLTAFGKFGASKEVAAFAGQRVRLEGTLVHRDDQTMLELVGGSISPLETAPGETLPQGDREDLGLQVLRGEIVDSKCFLGVMKPGNLKTHRACATRCISGGIPPILMIRTEEDRVRYVVLTDEQGQAIGDALLDRIAEPLEVRGRLTRRGDTYFLGAAPDAFVRL